MKNDVLNKLAFPICLIAVLGGAVPRSPAAGQDTRPGIVRVPARVFEGDKFVAGLKIGDFEVLEDGVPQKVRALYLVDKDAIERSEGEVGFLPFVGRRFTLMFQLFEYHPKLAEAIRYFVETEMRSGDLLEIQTPMKNYQLSAQSLAEQPRKAIADRLIEIVRKDIIAGSMAYNSLMNDLKKHIRSIGGANPMETLETDTETEDFSVELLLPRYRTIIQNLDNLRKIDTDKMAEFALALKKQRGRKFIFYFYQREFRPEIDPQVLNQLFSLNQDKSNILGELQELFQTYHLNFSQDVPRLKNAFADSGADFNLLFLNKNPERVARIVMREQSEDIFRALADVAEATGGVVDTSQNPAAGVRSALKISDRYYLLDYDTSNSSGDGAFKTISIKVRGKSYKVFHRKGYFN